VEACCRWRTAEWPPEALDWRGWLFSPTPATPIAGPGLVISLTGYIDVQRDVIKQLVRLTGAELTLTLAKTNTHVVSLRPGSTKHQAAIHWGVAAVNHLWSFFFTLQPRVE